MRYKVFRAVSINEAPDEAPEWWVVDMSDAEDREGPLVVARHGIEHEAIQDAEDRNGLNAS